MGNHHQAAMEVLQQGFQPFDGFNVQVVGRLVQQQQVGLLHPSLCQGNAFFLASRQIAD